MRKWFFLPVLASQQGSDADRLLLLVHIILSIVFIGWLIYGFYVLFRFRKRSNTASHPSGPRTRIPFFIEIAIVVLELTLLFGFSIPFWSRRVAANSNAGTDAIQVRVVAQQYVWNFHFPGPDGIFGKTSPELIDQAANPIGLDPKDPAGKDDVVALNTFCLPVNRLAVLTMTSKDVVHSFSVPEMRVKQDIIPGTVTRVAFTPSMTTKELQRLKNDPQRTFEVVCAQLCGLGHSTMRAYLKVVEPDEFEKWIKTNVAAPDPFAQ